MRISIRVKLILAICLPLLAVYVVMLTLEYRKGYALAISRMEDHLLELTSHQAVRLDRQLSCVAQVADSAAKFADDFSLDEEFEVWRLLRANMVGEPGVFGSCMAFEPHSFGSGRERYAPYICRSSPRAISGEPLREMDIAESYDYATWDWYRLPKQSGSFVWTEPFFDEGAGDVLMCTYSVPLWRDGQFRGVVTVDVSLDNLRETMAKLNIQGGHCIIVSRTGTFISHPEAARIMEDSLHKTAEREDIPELVEVAERMAAGEVGIRRVCPTKNGEPFWVIHAPIESTGWSLAAIVPEKHVTGPLRAQLNRQTTALVAGLAMIVFVVMLASTWISRPIERLAVAANQVAEGDLHVRVEETKSRDEIGQFTGTFNRMLADLNENVEARVEETTARKTLEKELQVARQIQLSMLPMVRPPYPERNEFTLHADNEPAKFMAGDFFDFWFVDDDVLAMVMADVSGKGVPAAMFMAVARTTIRNFSTPGRSPGETLEVANRIMASDNEEQMFVTVFHAHYHVRTGELIFANAGHNPPLVAHGDQPVATLGRPTGPVLGAWDDATFEDRNTHLDPGDLLLLFTDGVTEAHDADEVMYGDDRFIEMVEQLRDRPVEAICQEIIDVVNVFRNHEGQDDITLLALRRAR